MSKCVQYSQKTALLLLLVGVRCELGIQLSLEWQNMFDDGECESRRTPKMRRGRYNSNSSTRSFVTGNWVCRLQNQKYQQQRAHHYHPHSIKEEKEDDDEKQQVL